MDDLRAARRITRALFAAHAAGSAGVVATATVAAIVGAELSGREAFSGLPAAAFQLGVAFASLAIGVANDRWGRRTGLTLGAAVGAAGIGMALGGAVAERFAPLMLGSALAGAASASVKLGRFTAAEVNPPERRGRAVSTVVLAGAVGSVLGPLLVAPSGALTSAWGWGELAGPYLASLAAFALAAVAFGVFVRPEPRLLARRMAARAAAERERGGAAGGGRAAEEAADGRNRSPAVLLRDPGVVAAIGSMVLAQGVMVLLMVVTPLHMRAHAHALDSVSLVFAAHTFGMYAPALVSGGLTDRWGRHPVLLAGGLLLLGACLVAPLSSAVVPLLLALLLLGVGWNLCFVAGSAWLTDLLAPAERARIQGTNDLLMGLVSASASIGGGVAYAVAGYGVMAWGAALGAAALVALALRGRRVRRRPSEAPA